MRPMPFNIMQVSAKPGSPESLLQLVEMIKNPVANAGSLSVIGAGKDDKNKQSRDRKV